MQTADAGLPLRPAGDVMLESARCAVVRVLTRMRGIIRNPATKKLNRLFIVPDPLPVKP